MAEVGGEIKILHKTGFEWLDAEGKPVRSTYVTYQTPDGRVGSKVIRKESPSDEEILKAIKGE